MSKSTKKYIPFALGTLFGLTLAGMLFYLFAPANQTESNRIVQQTTAFNEDQTFKADEKQETEKPVVKATPVPMPISKMAEAPKEIAPQKTLDSVFELDTTLTPVIDDSVKAETPEKIIVKEAELINSNSIQIVNLSPPASAEEKQKDSLLAEMSGIHEHNNEDATILVELWQSPLNYKGYKMNKNKLMLYGLPSIETAKLFRLEGQIYMQLKETVYKLDLCDESQSFNLEGNSSIINRLK